MLSEQAKQIKQVRSAFNCTLKGYRKLFDFVEYKYIDSYKDLTDEDISSMIRVEKKLASRR